MIRVPRYLYDDMLAHAREGVPHEVCGILGGEGETVSRLFRMTNAEARNDHFMMEPGEQFAVAKELRGAGLATVAIYHSHPQTPARPSAEDVRLAFTPGVSYIIISLADLERVEVKSFRIEAGKVAAEELVVV